MKILVFEFATALGLDDPSLAAEGLAMLKGLLNDLQDKNVDYLIYNEASKKTPAIIESSCRPIFIKEDLFGWINNNIGNYDACLPIAPEENFILYKITKTIEENGVKIIGSSSDAVMTCSNKFKTYKALYKKVPTIKTQRIMLNDLLSDPTDPTSPYKYESLFKAFKMRVVKPADGVSCSGVSFVY